MVASTIGYSFDGGADDVVESSPKLERPTEVPKEPMPRADELEEDDDEITCPRHGRVYTWCKKF